MFRSHLLWAAAVCFVGLTASIAGIWLGVIVGEVRANSQLSDVQFRLTLAHARLEQLKKAMKEARVAIPPPDDDEPYPL
jgi:hypothetical protein